jgi:hypothetical protein
VGSDNAYSAAELIDRANNDPGLDDLRRLLVKQAGRRTGEISVRSLGMWLNSRLRGKVHDGFRLEKVQASGNGHGGRFALVEERAWGDERV